jgi:hypothetical protein
MAKGLFDNLIGAHQECFCDREAKRSSVGEHNEKPERFYEIVLTTSYPPYGEAFQRTARSAFVNLFEQRMEAAQ